MFLFIRSLCHGLVSARHPVIALNPWPEKQLTRNQYPQGVCSGAYVYQLRDVQFFGDNKGMLQNSMLIEAE